MWGGNTRWSESLRKENTLWGRKLVSIAEVIKNYNRNLFQENLRNLDWSIFDLLDNSEDMWSMIYKAILF